MARHIDVTDDDFKSKVIESDLPVVVDFWAPWCGPCRAIAPHLEKLAAQYDGKLVVAKINVDQNPNTPRQFQVKGIPAIKVFKQGEVVNEMTGMPRDAFGALERLVADVA